MLRDLSECAEMSRDRDVGRGAGGGGGGVGGGVGGGLHSVNDEAIRDHIWATSSRPA